ncbi:hypothetical protein ZWY2020_019572 [Hordeum vulgare]|nr:hypothetical protein ZWY2020_019572 [Hordeum vulgare]
MKTTNALSGSGMANLLIGARRRTLFSNYVVDMAFYYEHGYHKAFPRSAASARWDRRRPPLHERWRQRGCRDKRVYIRAKIAGGGRTTLLKDRSRADGPPAASHIPMRARSLAWG